MGSKPIGRGGKSFDFPCCELSLCMCIETFLTCTCVQRGIPVCASSGDHGLPNTLYFLRITYTTHARGRYNSYAASLKMSRSRCLQLLRRCMNTDNIIRKHAQPLHDATARGVRAHRVSWCTCLDGRPVASLLEHAPCASAASPRRAQLISPLRICLESYP